MLEPITSVEEFKLNVDKRSRKLVSSFERARKKADPESVHDLRKATRRLQVIVSVAGARHSTRKARKLNRRLRTIRHALGGWRDDDVMRESIASMQRGSAGAIERKFWGMLKRQVAKDRRGTIRKFRKSAAALKVTGLKRKVRRFVHHHANSHSVLKDMRSELENRLEKWHESMKVFIEDPSPAALHAVRIKAKTLRYLIDLCEDLFPSNIETPFRDCLKEIQEKVGDWHDAMALRQRSSSRLSAVPKSSARSISHRIKTIELKKSVEARKLILDARRSSSAMRVA